MSSRLSVNSILVIGGAGFLGKNFIETLLSKDDYKISSFDLAPSNLLPKKQSLTGSILDEAALSKAMADVDIVCHFAGMADIEECTESPVKAVQSNVLGATMVMDACVKSNVKRLIFASSVYASTNLGGVYRSTKLACESLLKDYQKYYDLDYTILRYGTLYGRGANQKNSIHRFLNEALKENKIHYQGNGLEMREYIHVLDAAELTIEAMKKEHANKTLILTGQKETMVKDLFAMISEILGKDIEVEYKDPTQKQLLKSHYSTTPYSYIKDMSKKLVVNEYIDLGRGLLDCIEGIENDRS